MDPDREYMNAAFIPGGDDFPQRWRQKAEAYRARNAPERIDYGPSTRERLDLFLPKGKARGLVVFIHGGYWLRFDRSDFSHLAAGPVARGWAVAMPSYTLAPEARISVIRQQIEVAVRSAALRIPGPLVVTGHSAGGFLAARMATLGLGDRVVPISPVAELEPLMATAMNKDLRIDQAEAEAESPARLVRRVEDVTVWVGGDERPAFLWQARTLAEAWACPWHVAPGLHHFDVIDGMEASDSPLTETLLGGL